MPIIIPQPIYHYGHHQPMTLEEKQVFIGAIVALTIIWVITSIFLIIKWHKDKEKYMRNQFLNEGFSDYYFFDQPIILVLFNIMMAIIWGIIIIWLLGTLMAKILF